MCNYGTYIILLNKHSYNHKNNKLNNKNAKTDVSLCFFNFLQNLEFRKFERSEKSSI